MNDDRPDQLTFIRMLKGPSLGQLLTQLDVLAENLNGDVFWPTRDPVAYVAHEFHFEGEVLQTCCAPLLIHVDGLPHGRLNGCYLHCPSVRYHKEAWRRKPRRGDNTPYLCFFRDLPGWSRESACRATERIVWSGERVGLFRPLFCRSGSSGSSHSASSLSPRRSPWCSRR